MLTTAPAGQERAKMEVLTDPPPGFPEDDDGTEDGGGPPRFTPALLEAYRERIADLRASKCDLTASIMRDEVLAQLEAWIDPAGLVYRATLQDIQGKQAAALALQICDFCGF